MKYDSPIDIKYSLSTTCDVYDSFYSLYMSLHFMASGNDISVGVISSLTSTSELTIIWHSAQVQMRGDIMIRFLALGT